ncbi:hypothetical protein [uncultured Treponema sp.]|uniref:hypothetical protein n=1 Tax=uncultured Treponema sp. TaxID=162155 RepID=UPI0025DF6E52|nr:hypothetical protein [uncultured Treponema sp.]
MPDAAFADFERQIEFLPVFQLKYLRNKIDFLLSHPSKSKASQNTLPDITSRLFGVAKFDGDYNEVLAEAIEEKYQ